MGLTGTRWTERGQRPVRVANCSGARSDPGYQMRRQAEQGEVDFITGDYLAEMNLAEHAEAMAAGKHDGWEPTCWDGLQQSLGVISQKNIKVIVNGGALNPSGLARKTQALVREKALNLTVAYVSGDDLFDDVRSNLAKTGKLPTHLDAENPDVHLNELATALLDTKRNPMVSAHAYLGARGIVKALEQGADIIICGRVADASPVIGAAWYWHSWKDSEYDSLAGALVAGHLIECSAYVTGANFSGFDEYDLDTFIDIPFGIAEIESDGTAVITKHETGKGLVNEDVVRCQFLYELQGAIYLNSDVTADATNIAIESVGKDRVRMSGIKGSPPPPTTKLAIFYRGGYQAQLLLNATGYGTEKKWELYEKQIRFGLKQAGNLDKFDILEFQIIGTPQSNPRSQFKSTTYCRVFAQATDFEICMSLVKTWAEFAMQHFSGFHCSLDLRTAIPIPYVAFYPALREQNSISEAANIISLDGSLSQSIDAGHPSSYISLKSRESFDAPPHHLHNPDGPTRSIRLGSIALGRSGDKGANLNFGIFPKNAAHWPWFRSFMARAKLQELIGEDWKDEYFIERMEFPKINAVHFVVYGILGRGVSSSTLLDSLGKGFADYIRDKVVEVPVEVLELNGEKEINGAHL